MGFENNNGSKIYCNIKEGKITHRSEGNKLELYDRLTGLLADIYMKPDGKFGRELHISLRDGKELYVLQMRLDSGYARGFMRCIKNAGLAEPMTLIPTYKHGKAENSIETGMIVVQNGDALKWYYTKDHPNGLPPMVPCKVKRDGILTDGWDNTDQMRFLLKMINEEIRPALAPNKVVQRDENISRINEQEQEQENEPDDQNRQPEDDLPF